MTASKTAAFRGKGTRWRGAPQELPVSLTRLRWALVGKLIFVVPVGLAIGGMLPRIFNTYDAESGNTTEALVGIVLSLVLFLGLIWRKGRKNRAEFAALGGDPNTVGVLLFGCISTRTESDGYSGFGNSG